MLNILIYSPQMASYGGIEQHLCVLARHLGMAGHRITLITTSNSLGLPMRRLLDEGGCCLMELEAPRGSARCLRKFLWLAKKLYFLRKTRWDVIYTNGQGGLSCVPWLLRKSGCRVMHHHHTSADLAEQESWGAIFLRVLKAAPLLVSNSFSTARNIQEATGRLDVKVLSYVTTDLFSPSEVSALCGGVGERVKFGFCGRLIAEKGVDIICTLSLREELADITWHLHGSGPGYDEAYFACYPNIVYHGPYSGGDDYRRILAGLDGVVLFTKHSEGRPLAIIEAMSAGLPWIASDRGGVMELAVDTVNSRIVPVGTSIEALSGVTRKLADDIRSGLTNRVAQRIVYDAHFGPSVTLGQWTNFICG